MPRDMALQVTLHEQPRYAMGVSLSEAGGFEATVVRSCFASIKGEYRLSPTDSGTYDMSPNHICNIHWERRQNQPQGNEA